MTPQRLDPMTLPLWGSRLIEASAGTGKTWTIAALYLRLVLGHGGEAAGCARPLLPSEILVMTFTRAATRELSDRIRARLVEAAKAFRGEAEPDALIAQLLAEYPPGPERTRAAWRLGCAAEAMDDAAVFTIDAWCQRMLREHAFDSRNLFDEELVADEQALVREAVRDYWRQQVVRLDGTALDAVLQSWPGLAQLHAAVLPLVQRLGAGDGALPALEALHTRLVQERRERVQALKTGWTARVQALREWFAAELDRKGCLLNRAKIQARYYEPWLATLEHWAATPTVDALALPPKARERLCPAGMREASKPGLELPDHFEAIEALLQALDALPSLKSGLLQHAAHSVARRVAALKAQAGVCGFADMLQRLDAALAGATGAGLCERIRAQYPVALIDEFQDTSPLQWRIFDTLYRARENARDGALLLIGDPKQSIYAFRGADIHSYLRARRATAGRHYMLDRNFRSTHGVVAAVNRLFEQAEQGAEAAFLFRDPESRDNPLPFAAVAAQGRPERLVCSAGEVPALSLCHDATLDAAAAHLARYAARCAERIVALLNDPQAGFRHEDGRFEPLKPADIAVLVRTGREAQAVRRELRRREVPSVYLSDKDSVFDGPEARDLLRWLRAVAAPQDLRLARAAWATALVGLPLAALAQLAHDDDAWEEKLQTLRRLRGVWERQGVLTMLRQTLHALDLPARWLAQPDGERRLTNVLHLAELLQAASTRLDGEGALVHWLALQVQGADGAEGGEERIVRLESDAELVKVVTIHKSKGLEYPVVFLPFAADFRALDKAGFVELAEGESRRVVLEPLREQLQQADRERLREDLRLLYVALTRARHALWVGVAAIRKGKGKAAACAIHQGALGRLLGGGEAIAESALEAMLARARGDCAHIALLPAPDAEARTPLRPREDAPTLQPGEPYAGRFERGWGIGSFSALVKHLSVAAVAAPHAQTAEPAEAAAPLPATAGREPDDEDAPALPVLVSAGAAWHRFPRGAFPGNFLHDQMEWLAGEGFTLHEDTSLREQLLRRCEREGWKNWRDEVVQWLTALVQVALPPVGAALPQLATAIPEMEFWLPSPDLPAERVDALCRAHLLGGRERPALPRARLQGLLMGFMDLVFEHDGRYWVLDYKSNALGTADADYHAGAMEQAMAAHRYDVQAALYLLALHRQLRARLGADYDPARQLGGAVFWFVRGFKGPQRGCVHIPADVALLDALDAALAGAPAAEGVRA